MSKIIDRENMTVEQERKFVENCFVDYEKDIAKTFWTPYDEYKDRIGQKFTVISRVTENEVDLECLPMWNIKFTDGTEIQAYPEEIVEIEIENNTPKNL